MKVRSVGLTPRVSRLPEHFHHDVLIEVGWLRLELTDAEALHLADMLHDATEQETP